LHFCVDARYLSKGFTNLKIDVDRFTAVDAPFALVVHVEEFMDRDTTVSNSCSLRFYHPNYHVRYAILRLKTLSRANKSIEMDSFRQIIDSFLIKKKEIPKNNRSKVAN
jgi:hypothetical protein